MPADYHTHTPLCKHAVGTPEEYITSAIASGLTEYGISDHAPCLPEPFDDWRMLEEDLPTYLRWIADAKLAARRKIEVRKGLECDWFHNCESYIEKLSRSADWDYLIGAVHYLDNWDFDNPKWLGRWAESDVDAVWSQYWETYASMARSGLFDILAHPDLVKKFSYRPLGDLARFYEPAIEGIIEGGSVIELNTAGWYKSCEECYPAAAFLKLAHSAGIGLVISSDAHSPNEVAREFPRAYKLAADSGYTELQTFQKRMRSAEKLVV